MNSRPKQPKYARNKNILVIGGSGSGKTRFFVKPNLMQMHSSAMLSQTRKARFESSAEALAAGRATESKVLNTINFSKNP